ncbi:MAG: DUF86 domain-containing protein [Parvularculaceae bacterium]
MIDRRTRGLLADMLENAKLAVAFVSPHDRSSFAGEIGAFYSAIRAAEIVGEAASQINASDRDSIKGVPWREAINMRNKLIHGYKTVRPEILHDTIKTDFPALIETLERILNESPTNGR